MDPLKQENHSSIGKVVFDTTLNQFAVLLEVYRENIYSVWFYRLEYVDGKKRDRFLSEINLNPQFHCWVIG